MNFVILISAYLRNLLYDMLFFYRALQVVEVTAEVGTMICTIISNFSHRPMEQVVPSCAFLSHFIRGTPISIYHEKEANFEGAG